MAIVNRVSVRIWLHACMRSPSLSGPGRGEREEEEKGRKEGEAMARAADEMRQDERGDLLGFTVICGHLGSCYKTHRECF